MIGVQPLSTQDNFLSPPVQISVLQDCGKKIFVAREDLLPGGTKQRAALHYVNAMTKKGFDHFVYPSPFCGFAQVALSYVCKILDIHCTIVAERDRGGDNESGKHEYTRLAEQYGARILLVDTLDQAEEIAGDICHVRKKSLKVPLGFDCFEFKSALKLELMRQWRRILAAVPEKPKALWLPVGSGTLANTFSQFIEDDIRLNCVDVHVLPPEDQRIRSLRENPAITLLSCPQPFAQVAVNPPTIPSNVYYDAKLWSFIADKGSDGDVWWNVGR